MWYKPQWRRWLWVRLAGGTTRSPAARRQRGGRASRGPHVQGAARPGLLRGRAGLRPGRRRSWEWRRRATANGRLTRRAKSRVFVSRRLMSELPQRWHRGLRGTPDAGRPDGVREPSKSRCGARAHQAGSADLDPAGCGAAGALLRSAASGGHLGRHGRRPGWQQRRGSCELGGQVHYNIVN